MAPMKPRQWMLLRRNGRLAVIVQILPNGDLVLMDRDTQVRVVWTEHQFQLALERGTVTVESTKEDRQTKSAISLGRSMALQAMKRNDKPMTAAGASRAFQMIWDVRMGGGFGGKRVHADVEERAEAESNISQVQQSSEHRQESHQGRCRIRPPLRRNARLVSTHRRVSDARAQRLACVQHGRARQHRLLHDAGGSGESDPSEQERVPEHFWGGLVQGHPMNFLRFRNPTSRQVLKRIGKTRPGIDDGMLHGFPMSPVPVHILTGAGHPGYSRKRESAPLVRVPLSQLYATQSDVERASTAFHIEHPQIVPRDKIFRGAPADKPVVVRYRGMLHIIDGHHRLEGLRLKGKRYARVRFVDLDTP